MQIKTERGARTSGPHVDAAEPQPDATPSQGRWVPALSGSGDGKGRSGPVALSWEITPTLLQRLLRGVSLPAAAGMVVFVAALVVTAVVMLRSMGISSEDSPSFAIEPAIAGEHGGTEAASDSQGEAELVIVHLVGEVYAPGVVELEAGARVLDAIEAAGGATETADLSVMNLARRVNDGEQIQVLDAATVALLVSEGKPPDSGGIPDAVKQSGGGGGTVNINTASADELRQLSGIGPALAERIVEWRDAHGRFSDVDQLTQVSGIGHKTLERFREQVSV